MNLAFLQLFFIIFSLNASGTTSETLPNRENPCSSVNDSCINLARFKLLIYVKKIKSYDFTYCGDLNRCVNREYLL